MKLQTSNDESNVGMCKSLSSKMPISSSKGVKPEARISKEALESWIKDNPDSYLTQAMSSFGVTYNTLLYYCRKYGISSFNQTKITKESLKNYLLSHPDVSYQDIADHFGVVKSTVKKSVDHHGLGHLKKHQDRWKNSKNFSKEDLELWIKSHPNPSVKKAAASFGVCPKTMSLLLNKHGLRICPLKRFAKNADIQNQSISSKKDF